MLFLLALQTTYAQIGIYAGMDMGVTVSKVNIISASDTKNVSGIDGVWGGIIGVNLKNNWSIESGYFGFITSSDVVLPPVGESILT